MKTTMLRVLSLGAVLALVALPLTAQRRPAARPAARARAAAATDGPRLGPHIGYNTDADAFLIGAQAAFPIAPAFDIYPSFDYYFVDVGSLWALNFDVRYRPPTRYRIFYVGGGLNYLRASAGGVSGSDTNLNLFGGLEGHRRRAAGFIETRLTVGDGSSFQIVAGASWRI